MTHKPLTDDELTNHKRLTVSMDSNFSFTEELRQRMLATIDALKADLAAMKAAQQTMPTQLRKDAASIITNLVLKHGMGIAVSQINDAEEYVFQKLSALLRAQDTPAQQMTLTEDEHNTLTVVYEMAHRYALLDGSGTIRNDSAQTLARARSIIDRLTNFRTSEDKQP